MEVTLMGAVTTRVSSFGRVNTTFYSLLKFLNEKDGENLEVCDFGCLDGLHTIPFLKKGYLVDAFDMNDLYVEIDGKSNLGDEPQSVLHKEFSMFKSYIRDQRNKKSSYELQDCVEGIKGYLEFLERIKELAGWRFEDVFFLQKKEACYMQISDLLLEMGEFYESKRYSDLAKRLFSSNI